MSGQWFRILVFVLPRPELDLLCLDVGLAAWVLGFEALQVRFLRSWSRCIRSLKASQHGITSPKNPKPADQKMRCGRGLRQTMRTLALWVLKNLSSVIQCRSEELVSKPQTD